MVADLSDFQKREFRFRAVKVWTPSWDFLMIFRNALLTSMGSADIEALFPSMREVTLGIGETLRDVGEQIDRVYFPSSAVISVVTVMEDGRSIEAASIGFESVAGLLAALTEVPPVTRMFVQIAGGAISPPAEKLRARAVQSPALMKLILRHAQLTLAQAEQSTACNALHLLHNRLARWLLITQDRVASATMLLTQVYMGVKACALRSSISLAASAFKEDRLINYSRGLVDILDRPGLERQACECYTVDRANREALLAGN